MTLPLTHEPGCPDLRDALAFAQGLLSQAKAERTALQARAATLRRYLDAVVARTAELRAAAPLSEDAVARERVLLAADPGFQAWADDQLKAQFHGAPLPARTPPPLTRDPSALVPQVAQPAVGSGPGEGAPARAKRPVGRAALALGWMVVAACAGLALLPDAPVRVLLVGAAVGMGASIGAWATGHRWGATALGVAATAGLAAAATLGPVLVRSL